LVYAIIKPTTTIIKRAAGPAGRWYTGRRAAADDERYKRP
jgi:hypothetical protein